MISKSAANAMRAMDKGGVRRFVALSTVGAGRSWNTIPWILKFIVSVSNLKHAFVDHGIQEEMLENSPMDYTVCRAPMLSAATYDGGVVATAAEKGPAGKYLSRNSAAEFFLDIIENNLHIRETVNLANKPE
jgi:hypothetical protein